MTLHTPLPELTLLTRENVDRLARGLPWKARMVMRQLTSMPKGLLDLTLPNGQRIRVRGLIADEGEELLDDLRPRRVQMQVRDEQRRHVSVPRWRWTLRRCRPPRAGGRRRRCPVGSIRPVTRPAG